MRRCLALALALGACGGGETVGVQVSLGLDEISCMTTDPTRVTFSCATSVGVWVREADDGGFAGPILRQACVDLPGDSPSLADLPQVLAGIDLDGLDDRAVIVELAVYSPGSAADGCPTLDDFVIETMVYGETTAIVLSAAEGGLDLELFCEIYDDPTELCEEDCQLGYDTCVAEPVDPCDTAYDTCIAGCSEDDLDCQSQCDADYETCTKGDGEVSCERADGDCYAQCDVDGGGDECYSLCDTQYAACVEARCTAERDTCVEGCADDPGGEQVCIAVEP